MKKLLFIVSVIIIAPVVTALVLLFKYGVIK